MSHVPARPRAAPASVPSPTSRIACPAADPRSLCTWLSIDGGVSWAEVAEGAYIYEYADWGGLLVMTRHPGIDPSSKTAVADEVRFSLDYGRCWQVSRRDIPVWAVAPLPLLLCRCQCRAAEPAEEEYDVCVHIAACAPRACRGIAPPLPWGVHGLDLRQRFRLVLPSCS